MKLLILFVLLLSFFNLNSALTYSINYCSSAPYGVVTKITIYGNSNFNTPSSITIGGIPLTNYGYGQDSDGYYVTGYFNGQLVPANTSTPFPVTVSYSSGISATANLFKYAPPIISTYEVSSNIFYFAGANLAPLNDYKITVTDFDSKVTNISTFTTAENFFIFVRFNLTSNISSGNCTIQISDGLGFYYAPIITSIQPVITDISPKTWNVSSQNITVTGLFLGSEVIVSVGTYTVNNITVSENGTFVFSSPNGFQKDRTITISTLSLDSVQVSNVFNYTTPTIREYQNNDTIVISETNMGIDRSFLKFYINGIITDYGLGYDVMTVKMITPIPIGFTNITITADTQTVTSLFLMAPVIFSSSEILSNGGSVSLSGLYLNDCDLELYNGNGDLVRRYTNGDEACKYSINGTSVVCKTPPMVADTYFKIDAIRYGYENNVITKNETASITSTVIYSSESSSLSSSSESDGSDVPSNSYELLVPFGIILSLISIILI